MRHKSLLPPSLDSRLRGRRSAGDSDPARPCKRASFPPPLLRDGRRWQRPFTPVRRPILATIQDFSRIDTVQPGAGHAAATGAPGLPRRWLTAANMPPSRSRRLAWLCPMLLRLARLMAAPLPFKFWTGAIRGRFSVTRPGPHTRTGTVRTQRQT